MFRYIDQVWKKAHYTADSTDTQVSFVQDGNTLVIVFEATESLWDVITSLGAWYDVGVHSGYLRAFHSVRDRVDFEIQKHPGARVYFIGHSLGGAIAQVFQKVYAEIGMKTWCYATGSPKPLSSYWLPRTTLYEAYGDPIPSLPPWGQKAGDVVKLGKPKWWHWLGFGWGNHLPKKYKEFV